MNSGRGETDSDGPVGVDGGSIRLPTSVFVGRICINRLPVSFVSYFWQKCQTQKEYLLVSTF